MAVTASSSLMQQALVSVPDQQLSAWSLAVSFLGDCIVPRGGIVGMATITQLLGAYGIDNGVVRTAMSRLASDGWVSRTKSGRNAFYSLTELALRASQAASARIYAPMPPADPCGWHFHLLKDLTATDRRKTRDLLARHGAGNLDAYCMVLPQTTKIADKIQSMALCVPVLEQGEAKKLVAASFDLAEIERSYINFCQHHEALAQALENGAMLSGLEAVALRVLTVHRFRRIVLRDPGIPAPYLPENWPGLAARTLLHRVRHALHGAAELWLDQHATGTAATPS